MLFEFVEKLAFAYVFEIVSVPSKKDVGYTVWLLSTRE